MIFVTALINIQESRIDRGLDMRFAMFQKLAATGIRLHVFVDPEYADRVHVPNGVVEVIDFNALETVQKAPEGLPAHRLECKDTRGFMLLMNAKLEFVKRCMDTTTASHYAWIDFSVYHVLTDPEASTRIRSLANRWYPSKCLFFPGCIGPGVLWDRINWRFCGGFFLGDRDSLYDLYDTYIQTFPTLPKLCWEVNVWAYLEHLGQKFDWFSGNHDNSILAVPSKAACIPPNLDIMWSSPDLMFRVRGPIYNFIVACAAPYALTPIFYKSDGALGDHEYDTMIESLGRPDGATMPARDYAKIEACALPETKPLLCTQLIGFYTPSALLVPWDDDMFEVGVAKYDFPKRAWHDKISKAVWRGGSSGFHRPSLRMRLAAALETHPLADVKFVHGGWPINDNVIPAEHFGNGMTKYEQAEYKYIFVVDGNSSASNGQWAFCSGSVPLYITHPSYRWWFQSELIPMVNYVPIQWDLSDLDDKLAWLRDNDAAACAIAQQAVALGKQMLSPENQRAYLARQILLRAQEVLI